MSGCLCRGTAAPGPGDNDGHHDGKGAGPDEPQGYDGNNRVVATTTFNNVASIGVMKMLGMRLLRNPHPDPPRLQVVGLLECGSPWLRPR